MSHHGFLSPLSEDISSWIQSVVNFVKDTRANCLDLRAVPILDINWRALDIRAICVVLIGSEITEIHLENKDLTDKIQGLCEVLSRSKIKKLNFKHCFNLKVGDVLSLMAALKDTQVTELDISGNSVEFENQQIHEFVFHLANSQLKSLNLSGIGMLPFESAVSVFLQGLPYTQISCLDLSGFFILSGYSSRDNHTDILHTFVLCYLQHTAITCLNLGSNRLGDPIARAIGAVLVDSKLEKLNLCNNDLTDSGVDFLIPGLVFSKITHLNLSHNRINGNNGLGPCLKLTRIKDLDLSANCITKETIFSGPNFLQGSSIDTLKLSCHDRNNRTNLFPIEDIRFSELTTLDLSYNNLDLNQITALAVVWSDSKLTHINLAGCTFPEASFSIIGGCLKKSKLKYINFSHTVKSLAGINGVASFLDKTKDSAIISVDLSGNGLGREVDIFALNLANTKFLALDLPFNNLFKNNLCVPKQLTFTSITALNLSATQIRDNGATALAECLKETHITILNLRYNSITSLGAEVLALALKSTKLRYLDLAYNKIENYGLECLAENAKNSCITYLNVEYNPGKRKLLVDRVLWENRRKIHQFDAILKQTEFLTGDSDIFRFDRDFGDMDIEVFIQDCLTFYKFVSENQLIVSAIEQDKCILDLKIQECFKFKADFYETFDIFIEDCELMYRKIVEHPSPIQGTVGGNKNTDFFQKQCGWLILEKFPRQFVSFIAKDIEADLGQHVSLLRKIEELELTGLVELLLLNRPLYVIDKKLDILHPYVYKLLLKYKQPICNLEIEPKGMQKIIEYFTHHIDSDGASEVISALCSFRST